MTTASERQAFYDRIAPANLAPLWEQLHSLVTPEPTTSCVPALWRYEEVRPRLMEAGGLITAQEAQRRVLILENPGMRGQATITGSLFAGLQLILPGEVAPAHRHTQSALRFIIDDHGNDTEEPMVWLDGLDIQIVKLLSASFAEQAPAEVQAVTRPEGDSAARFGNNLLPVDWKPAVKTSPVFNYPYARTREALATLARNGAPDPYHGHKMRYVNPASGDYAMPTIGTFMQLLPKGFATRPYRSTDGTVYVAVEGSGETRVGEQVFRWQPRDIFVAPSWKPVSHQAGEEAVLFSYSDRPVQEKLGLWREQAGNA